MWLPVHALYDVHLYIIWKLAYCWALKYRVEVQYLYNLFRFILLHSDEMREIDTTFWFILLHSDEMREINTTLIKLVVKWCYRRNQHNFFIKLRLSDVIGEINTTL